MPVQTRSTTSRAATVPGSAALPSRRFSRWSLALESAAVFALGVTLMHLVYDGQTGVPGHDSFYHVRMALLMPEHGLLRELPWLKFVYFTREGHAFVNHHYGFQLLLAPFVKGAQVWTGDALAGARLAMVVFHGLTLVMINLILRAVGARWRWIWWIVYVLLPFQFFVRHAYVRAIGLSLACMMAIVWCLVRERRVLLAIVIAAYIHIYLGGVLYAPVLVGLFVLGGGLGTRQERRSAWRIALWSAAGWIVGLITHPYAGGVFEFLRLQVFGSGLTPDIPVGREWKPYQGVWWFARMSGVILVVWTIALLARLRTGPNLKPAEWAITAVHFVFLGLTFKARRFIEYWPAFALLSSAVLASPLLARWDDRLGRLLHGRRPSVRTVRSAGAVLATISALAVAAWSPMWDQIRRSVRSPYDLLPIRDAMTFLQSHSRPGDVVFTDDWDIFPVYFYFNAHNHYIVGLDPKFTESRRPMLWARYVKISRGEVPADVTVRTEATEEGNPSSRKTIHVTLDDIRTHFGARFVITDCDHKKLARKLARRPDLAELIYPGTNFEKVRDEPYLIFRIRKAERTTEQAAAARSASP
ncbi:MAG: hypothetical protein D6788_05260 [Planctomycetota bacterium]|nr:MAG: hypothetical protein D6788_05260 [Planctomycetota bacterium]